MDFEDNSFDYVIATFVFCSVPDPVKGLEEIRRVLKPEGRIILIEHVLSNYKTIAVFEHLHNPITKTFFGFNVNRDTKNNILKAGIKIEEDKELALFDVFRKFTCTA